MKRRLSYSTDSEFLRVRLTRAQKEKLLRISKKISPLGLNPKVNMAIRYLIEKEEV